MNQVRMNSASSLGGERPQTAYGWQDAMSENQTDSFTPGGFGGQSVASQDEFGMPSSSEGYDSIVIQGPESIHEKRFNKEKRKSRKRLQQREGSAQSKGGDSLSGADSQSISSASGIGRDPLQETPSQQQDKDDLLKAKILKCISKYNAQKLKTYCERAKKLAPKDDIGSMFIRECIVTGLKQLLRKHSGTKEDDSNLLKLISVVLISFENTLERSSLFGFCRVLYKISKDSSHDDEFRDNNILIPLMNLIRYMCESVKGKKDWEMLLYCVAILKNVSYDSQENKTYISSYNALALLKTVLESIVRHLAKEKKESTERPLQLLVQVTACLRNLAHTEEDFDAIAESGLLQILCPMMKNLVGQQEFILNSCRILSKVSLHEQCQNVMNEDCPSFYSTVIMVLQQYKSNVPVVIRICFILGNLTFDNEAKRAEFSLRGDVPLLLNLLDTYDKKDTEMHKKESQPDSPADKPKETTKQDKQREKEKRDLDDLLTKLIRLIANISIDHERGSYLAFSMQTESLIRILERKSVQTAEELVLNVVRCITNLTYYGNEARSNANGGFVPDSTLFKHKMRLCEQLSPLLLHDHPDAILEAARTFGNLSQDEQVQQWMKQKRLDEVTLILIDHSNFDIVSAVCGVLINLTGQESDIFTGTNIERLIEVLDYANESLAILIFKLLHNLVVNTPSDKLDHLDLIYDHVENIVESLEEHDDLTEDEENLISIGKRLLEELAYEEL